MPHKASTRTSFSILGWQGMPIPSAIAAQLPASTCATPHVRIPALTVTASNRLIAAFDLRPSFHDLPGAISIVYRTSDDCGQTWSDLHLLIAAENGWGYGDASLISTSDGRILCLYIASKGLSFWDDGAIASQRWELRLAVSDDDGATWQHRHLTSELFSEHPEIASAFFSSGNGIQLSSGRLVNPLVWHSLGERTPHVSMAMSDDAGAHWFLGEPILGQADETKVIELADGTLAAAIRGYPQRLVAYSQDHGLSWSQPIPMCDEPGCNAGFAFWNGQIALTIPQPQLAPVCKSSEQFQALGDPSCGRSAGTLQDWSARRHLCLLTGSDAHRLELHQILDPSASAYSAAIPLPSGDLAIAWEHGNYEEIRFSVVRSSEAHHDAICDDGASHSRDCGRKTGHDKNRHNEVPDTTFHTEKKAGFCGLTISTDGGLNLKQTVCHPQFADRIVDFESKY